MTLVVDGAVTLAVGWRQGKKILGGRVELTMEVADFLRTVASNAAQEIGERTDKPYSADSYLEQDEVFALPVASALIESDIIDIVRNSTALPRIRAGELPRKPLLFYATVVGDDPTARTSFVRATNPVVTAGTGRVLTRLAQSLTSVSEPVFALERRVDLAVTDDQIYVLPSRPAGDRRRTKRSGTAGPERGSAHRRGAALARERRCRHNVEASERGPDDGWPNGNEVPGRPEDATPIDARFGSLPSGKGVPSGPVPRGICADATGTFARP